MAYKKLFSITKNISIHNSHESLNREGQEFSIVAIEDDDTPPEYFFTSDHLTGLTDTREIWSKGLFLLGLYNGAVNISEYSDGINSEVEFVKLFNRETNENLTPSDTLEIVPQSPFPSNSVTDELKKEEMKNRHFIAYATYLAKTEKDVESLLLLAGKKLNWITLYSILDTLIFYCGGKGNFSKFHNECGYSKNDIKSFTGTSNNFGLLGLNSRHGEQGLDKPKATITLKDARRMILHMTKCYIDKK